MSSRLMPPKVGSSAATTSTNFSMFFCSTSMSKQSITGLEASGPMSPSPSTAVPLVMTATRFCREVSSAAWEGSSTIASQAAATPGE